MATGSNQPRWPWQWVEAARTFILSPPFQAAVQFSVGTFLAGLFVFVRPISFPLACLAALLLVVVVAVLSPDNHIGTRLMGAATLLGSMAWGLVLGGAVLSLSHVVVRSICVTSVGCSAHTAILCCLSVPLLAALGVNRAALGPPYPPHVWVAGMVATLSYGLVLIAGQFTTHLGLLWTNVVGGLLLSCLVASGLSALVSLAVLPSLATDEMRADAAAAIRGIGHAATRFASRGLQREDTGAPFHPHHPHRSHLGPRLPPPPPSTPGAALLAAHSQPTVGGVAASAGPTGPGGQQPPEAAAAEGAPPKPPPPQQQQQQRARRGDALQTEDIEADWGRRFSDHSDYSTAAVCRRRDSNGNCSELENPVQRPPRLASAFEAAPGTSPASAPGDLAGGVGPTAAAPAPLPGSPRRASGARASPSLDPWDSARSAVTPVAAATATAAAAREDESAYAVGGGGDGGGGQAGSFSQPASLASSDDESPAWPLHSLPRPRGRAAHTLGAFPGSGVADADGDFEHVMEDEDAFLRLLQEATAPQPQYVSSGKGRRVGRRHGRTRAAPPPPLPVVAPPGGILPSPSTRDLMGLAGAASVTILSSPALPGVAEVAAKGKHAGAAGTAALAGGYGHGEDADGAAAGAAALALPGSGGATAAGGGGVGATAVPWAPVSALRPLLARARACSAAAAVEPPCMIRGPADLGRWSRLLTAAETLLSRVAALECLLEDHRAGQPNHSLGDVSLAAVLGVDVVSPYRRVYGEVAASCAAASVAIVASMEVRRQQQGQAFKAVGGWRATRERLRSVARTALSTYWARVRATHRGGEAHAGLAARRGSEYAHAAAAVAVAAATEDVGASGGRQQQPQSQAVPSPRSASKALDTAVAGSPDDQQHHRQHRHPATHGSLHVHLHHHIQLKLGSHRTQNQQSQQQQQQDGSHNHDQVPYHHHHHTGRQYGGSLRVAARIRTISLHQARAITFLWTVTEGVISAAEELETAVQLALSEEEQQRPPSSGGKASAGGGGVAAPQPPSRSPSDSGAGVPPPGSSSFAEVAAKGRAGSSSSGSGSEGRGSGGTGAAAGGGGADGAVVLSFGEEPVPPPTERGEKANKQRPRQERQRRQPGSWAAPLWAANSPSGLLLLRWGWSRPLVELCLGLPMLRFGARLLAAHCTTLLGGGAGARWALLSSRLFQYYVKYVAVSAGSLCLILGLAARPDAGFMRRYPMLYAYIATSVSMFDRVEATLSRSLLRAAGTLAGGLLGLWVMMIHSWAHSPEGLLAVVSAVASLTGCLATHRLLYGAYLTVGTLLSIVFCQYGTVPYCCTTPSGTLEMFAARVVSVLLGCTLPVLFSQAVLPWYTSDWALEIIAAAFLSSSKIVRRLYDAFFDLHLRAHVSSCGAPATAELLRQYGMEGRAEKVRRLEARHEDGQEEEGEVTQQQHQQQPQQPAGGDCSVSATSQAAAGEDGAGGGGDEDAPGAELGKQAQPGGRGSGGAAAAAAAPATPPAAAAATAAAAAASIAEALRSSVSGPLVSVQTSLMKDTAVWSRGIYAVPRRVPALLRCGLLLADRLAALQLVVADTPPPLYGRLSGWAFERMVLPLHSEMEAVLTALDRLAAATARLLIPGAAADKAEAQVGKDPEEGTKAAAGPDPSAAAAAVVVAVQELHMSRLQIRQHIHDMRRAFHADVRSLDEQHVSYATHPDDTVHVNSMLYALVKTLDKATALARTAVEFHSWGEGRGRQRAGGIRRWCGLFGAA